MNDFFIQSGDLQISESDFLIRLLVATGIGFLIGLEREHSGMIQNEPRFAGIRTFILLSLLGFCAALLHYILSPWMYFAILVSVAAYIGISYRSTSSRGDIGSTTEFAALLVFILGTLSFLGYYMVSLLITVLALVMLNSKLRLHSMIGKITADEMFDFVSFVVVALLVFPFLPDRQYGPEGLINPREIGWVMLLFAGIKFLGYLLTKFLDASRGIIITGLIGGMFSSTLVTWVFSKKSNETPQHSTSCSTAIMAASTILILRVIFWLFVFNKNLGNMLLMPMIALLTASAAFTLYLFYRSTKTNGLQASPELPKGKPLDLSGALFFGILYTAFTLLVFYTQSAYGQSGIVISGAIAGLSDLDAITITVSKLALNKVHLETGAWAILIATISNTLVKLGIALWRGSRQLRIQILTGYGLIALVGFVTMLMLYLK